MSNGYASNPASAGSQWEAPSSGFAPVASKPHLGTPPLKKPNYPQPSLQTDPAASYSSNFAAPSAYASSLPAGSPYPSSFQPTSSEGNYGFLYIGPVAKLLGRNFSGLNSTSLYSKCLTMTCAL